MERLNDNEVKEIVEMQKKIDSYESFILAIWMMIKSKKDVNFPLFTNIELDVQMSRIWKWVKEHK